MSARTNAIDATNIPIIQLIQTHGPLTFNQLRRFLPTNLPLPAIYNRLGELIDRGDISRSTGVFSTKYRLPISPPDPIVAEPYEIGTIARLISAPIIFAARLVAFIVALTLWIFPIAPVWLALLMRTIAVFSWATVLNLFKGTQPPDEDRLNFVASFWANGFVQILSSLRRREPVMQVMPSISLWNPWQELAIACLFYLYLATSFAYLSYWLAFVAGIITGISQIAHIVIDGIMRLYYYRTISI